MVMVMKGWVLTLAVTGVTSAIGGICLDRAIRTLGSFSIVSWPKNVANDCTAISFRDVIDMT